MHNQGDDKQIRVKISIHHKIVLYTALLVLITVVMSTYVAVKAEMRVLTKGLIHTGRYVAGDIAFGAEKAFGSLNWVFVEKMLTEAVRSESGEVTNAKIVKPNGEIYMADDRACYGEMVDPNLLVDKETILEDFFFPETKEHGILLIHPTTIAKEQWYVMVGLSLKPVTSAVKSLIARNVAWGTVIVACGIIGSFILSRSIAKPIIGLAKAAKVISDGNLNYRVVPKTRDEIGVPGESFNNMTEHLQQTTTSIDNLNREIAERKEAEQSLQKSEGRFQLVARATNDAVWDWDLPTNKVWWNEAVRILFGYSADEVGPDADWWKENIHPEDRQRVVSGIHAVVDSGQRTWSDEYRFRCKDASYATVFDRGFIIHDNTGKPVRMLGSMMDITNRKKAEQRQAQLLEQVENANRELKDFAYVVSHDLKAPLRGIKTLADWISTDYADKLDEDGRDQISLLSSRVNRMHNLIEGILQYSRVGRVKEEKALVSLNELVPNIIDTLAPPESIAITIENELPVIECEQTRIIQVFQNLLSNAIKYMDKPHGQIKIDYVEENGFWTFSVTDNGPGIEEKYFEKIFQMFQTLSPRDEFESTGVGLTLVKKIVDLHGGKIWLESKVGEGSTFFFTLPKSEMGVKDAKLQANIVS